MCFATSCKDDGQPPITPAKMKLVLSDLQLAEVYSAMVDDSNHIYRSKNVDSLSRYYKEILAHHKITKAQFAESIEWYKRNPDKLDSVYAAILPQLSKLEGDNPQ